MGLGEHLPEIGGVFLGRGYKVEGIVDQEVWHRFLESLQR